MITTITNWNDLEQFGIEALTGEADALSLRLLCDLTQEGANLVRDFFGLAIAAPFCESMNSGKHCKHGEHVASVMLPKSIFEDLAVFCLARAGYVDAIKYDHMIAATTETNDDDWVSTLEYARVAADTKVHTYRLQKQTGNTHAMSGRTIG